MGLRATDETATNQYKQFWSWNAADSSKDPYIEVWYSLPPNPVDPDAALWATQSTLSDFRNWTVNEVGTGSGYIDSINDAKTTSVTLLWAGAPNAMQADVLAEAQRRTITATVVQRQYTKDQLTQAAAAAMASSGSGSGVFANFHIDIAIPVSPDFDGVTINGQHNANPADTAAADQALSQQATQALGVAVKVQTTPSATPAATPRDDDSPAFNAGGFMTYRKDGKDWVCTTGFALKVGSSTYTTTARHCNGTNFLPYHSSAWFPSKYQIKSFTGDGAAALLNVSGSQLMFFGGIKSTSRANVVPDPTTGNAGKNVGNGPGDYVCTSGANSGTHCGGGQSLRVYTWGVPWDDTTGHGTVSTIIADRVDGGLAVVSGDSGGPVYANKTATQVYAVGMIQASYGAKYPAPCGLTAVKPLDCSSRVYYTSTNSIITSVPNAQLYYGQK